MSYYTLAILQGSNWSQEFGDFDKETVEYELEDYLQQYNIDTNTFYKKKELKIIKTNGTQKAIETAIQKLNSKE